MKLRVVPCWSPIRKLGRQTLTCYGIRKLGKRSGNLTRDMTVETALGNQQLKTEYSRRVGRHADLGGEINRNEIPLMYQQYIRDYMEAVRKQQQKSQ